jgi:xylulokinase
MDRLVERTPPGSGGLFFAPWLVGERTPVEDPSLRGGFFNLSLSTDRGAIVRAVYEGVALNLKWLLGHVERFCGRPFERLNFIGGGARSDPWCQILADVLDRPIAQLADPLSANARGAAFLAAVANGTLAWEQIPERVEVRRVYTPRDELRALHDEMFREFMAIHRATRPICARLNRRRPALPSPREHP